MEYGKLAQKGKKGKEVNGESVFTRHKKQSDKKT